MVKRTIVTVSNQRHNLGHYCLRTFEMAKGSKERWCRQELNPGPLAYAANALPLSYNTPTTTTPFSRPNDSLSRSERPPYIRTYVMNAYVICTYVIMHVGSIVLIRLTMS